MKKISMYVLAAFFVAAGIGHFVMEDFFVSIVPEYLPAPRALVWISGVAELAGGIGLLVPRLRRAAAWGLVALLVAVFPANIDMALHPRGWAAAPEWMGLADPNPLQLWLRLPVQLVLIAWAWLYTRRA